VKRFLSPGHEYLRTKKPPKTDYTPPKVKKSGPDVVESTFKKLSFKDEVELLSAKFSKSVGPHMNTIMIVVMGLVLLMSVLALAINTIGPLIISSLPGMLIFVFIGGLVIAFGVAVWFVIRGVGGDAVKSKFAMAKLGVVVVLGIALGVSGYIFIPDHIMSRLPSISDLKPLEVKAENEATPTVPVMPTMTPVPTVVIEEPLTSEELIYEQNTENNPEEFRLQDFEAVLKQLENGNNVVRHIRGHDYRTSTNLWTTVYGAMGDPESLATHFEELPEWKERYDEAVRQNTALGVHSPEEGDHFINLSRTVDSVGSVLNRIFLKMFSIESVLERVDEDLNDLTEEEQANYATLFEELGADIEAYNGLRDSVESKETGFNKPLDGLVDEDSKIDLAEFPGDLMEAIAEDLFPVINVEHTAVPPDTPVPVPTQPVATAPDPSESESELASIPTITSTPESTATPARASCAPELALDHIGTYRNLWEVSVVNEVLTVGNYHEGCSGYLLTGYLTGGQYPKLYVVGALPLEVVYASRITQIQDSDLSVPNGSTMWVKEGETKPFLSYRPTATATPRPTETNVPLQPTKTFVPTVPTSTMIPMPEGCEVGVHGESDAPYYNKGLSGWTDISAQFDGNHRYAKWTACPNRTFVLRLYDWEGDLFEWWVTKSVPLDTYEGEKFRVKRHLTEECVPFNEQMLECMWIEHNVD